MKVAVILEKTSDLESKVITNKDLIWEFRIDKDQELLKTIEKDPRIIERTSILTLRSKSEGGDFLGNRQKILERMAQLQPTYLDVEFDQDEGFLLDLQKSEKTTIVISKHDYSDLMHVRLTDFIEMTGKYHNKDDTVIKFIGKPIDCYDMLKSVELASSVFPRHVVLGIGKHGLISRTLGDDFGQEFVFGNISENPHIPNVELIHSLQAPDSLQTGLIGKSLDHSLSPRIHQIFRNQVDIRGYYHLLEIHEASTVEYVIKQLAETNIKGLNVTSPYKETVTEFCENDPLVQKSGVANTLSFDKGKIHAYNTDISGFGRFYDNIEVNEHVEANNAVIIGGGGAARAVCFALVERGIDVTVINRSEERFKSWTPQLQELVNFKLLQRGEGTAADIYINATTLGYHGENIAETVPISENTQVVIDLNYHTKATPLVDHAKRLSKSAYDGKEMLYHQAADAFEIWTGLKVSRDERYWTFMEEIL